MIFKCLIAVRQLMSSGRKRNFRQSLMSNAFKQVNIGNQLAWPLRHPICLDSRANEAYEDAMALL